MLSVTQRIKTVIQPQGGYVPKKLFSFEQYDDGYEIADIIAALSAIQGLAVDYLTRFMIFHDKISAFDISICGAQRIDEYNQNDSEYKHVMALLENVNGLDDISIRNACEIVSYDIAFRQGVRAYHPLEDNLISADLIQNIRVMVKRGVRFLETVGPIIADEFTFEGGYTELVSSGDGDYLTQDMIIDFKVSKTSFSSKWSLQLLMYYLLGIHSIHDEFQNMTAICIFNPYKNQSYIAQISDITDETKYNVSHAVIGYQMEQSFSVRDAIGSIHYDYSSWANVNGSSSDILKEYLDKNMDTDFDVTKYEDGIHDISIDNYWTFLRTIDTEYVVRLRPLFRHTDHIKMIKNNGYLMFLSVSPNGKLSILNGGGKTKTSYSPEYYYDNIERYSKTVMTLFSKYWDALYSISAEVLQLKSAVKKKSDNWCDERREISGKVHGCIIDIDYYNHLYLNPYDGSVIPYYADSMSDKLVYKSTMALLTDQKPDTVKALKKWIKKNPQSPLALSVKDTRTQILEIPKEELVNEVTEEDKEDEADDYVDIYDEADTYDLEAERERMMNDDSVPFAFGYERVFDTSMYTISRRLKSLQKIYDCKVVQAWYDDVLKDDPLLLEDKYLYVPKKASRQKLPDKSQGLIKTLTKSQLAAKNKYMGMTRQMNCGLNATVIDYINSNDITVQFEDGLVKSHVRTNKFMTGSISHSNPTV